MKKGNAQPSVDWTRIGQIYAKAMELDPVERQVFIEREVGTDATTRKLLEGLFREGGDFLEHPLPAGALPDPAAPSAPSIARLPIGTVLDHFRITRVVGEGGMGVVYEAEDSTLSRKVVLKTISERLLGDATIIERFKTEALSLASLNHPNIVTIYSFGAAQGTHYIAMEYVQGRSLDELLRAGTPSVSEAIGWFTQIARALKAAHERQIIHRDIKPSNILLKHDGTIKLMDFGIAKPAVSPEGSELTKTGVVIGTLDYLAPEVLAGRAATPASDVYSLGLTFYEILTGQRQRLSQRSALSFPSTLRLDLPASLDRLVAKMCEAEPRFRFRNAAEVERALGAIPPNPAPPAQVIPLRAAETRARKPARAQPSSRRASGVPYASAVVLLVVLAALGYLARGARLSERFHLSTSSAPRAKELAATAVANYPVGLYAVWTTNVPVAEKELEENGFVGISLQVIWSDIEGPDGSFRWRDLEDRLSEAKKANLKVALSLITDVARASALVLRDPSVRKVRLLSTYPPLEVKCRMVEVPVFWDVAYRARKKRFIEALGARFSTDPSIVAVTASFANFNSDVWWLPAESGAEMRAKCGTPYDNAAQWERAGYTASVVRQEAEATLRITAEAFPRQAIKLPVEVSSDRLRPVALVADVLRQAYAKYPDRIFAQMETLDTATRWSTELGADKDPILQSLARHAPRIGVQLLSDATGGPQAGCIQNHAIAPCPAETTLNASLDRALSYGPTFVEVQPADALNDALAPSLRAIAARFAPRAGGALSRQAR